MALIYLLNNLIIARARNELSKSLNLPQILLSSLHLKHCPKHPITSSACTQHFLHKSHQFLTCFLLCHFAELFLPAWWRSVCKNHPHPQFWDIDLSPSQFKGALFSTLGFYNPTIRRSWMALGNPGLVLVAFVSASQQL